jgi:hypothetical protein
VEIISLEHLRIWKKENNNNKTNHMKRDKGVEEVLKEIKKIEEEQNIPL